MCRAVPVAPSHVACHRGRRKLGAPAATCAATPVQYMAPNSLVGDNSEGGDGGGGDAGGRRHQSRAGITGAMFSATGEHVVATYCGDAM